VHGAQHLDVAARVEAEPGGDAAGDDAGDQRRGGLGLVGAEPEEVGVPAQGGRPAGVDLVGADDDAGLLRLPEDLRQLDTEGGVNTLRGRMRSWWSLASGKNSAAIVAIGTVALVLLTAALLIVALRLGHE
jgi:hypothetical protein